MGIALTILSTLAALSRLVVAWMDSKGIYAATKPLQDSLDAHIRVLEFWRDPNRYRLPTEPSATGIRLPGQDTTAQGSSDRDTVSNDTKPT
jgi:hypothetical protein